MTIEKIKNLAKKQFFLKIFLPLLAFFLLANAIFSVANNPKREIEEPEKPIAISAFEKSISGLGVAEPKSEIINIGSDSSGIVKEVYVVAGAKIRKNQKLFTIDDRQAKANLDLREAEYKSAVLDAQQKNQEFAMYKKITDSRAYSKDEFNKKRLAAEIANQQAKKAKAEASVARVALEKLTIKSPIDGEVLKVDVRVGEFAQAGGVTKNLITVGDMSVMHVRVEIDESEAHKINPTSQAIAYLRGNANIKIALNFVRIEPYVVPKVSISASNAEKIDSRVLQVIYSFENNSDTRILAGQQLDVYIEDKNS